VKNWAHQKKSLGLRKSSEARRIRCPIFPTVRNLSFLFAFAVPPSSIEMLVSDPTIGENIVFVNTNALLDAN
jgi:hypothetical protein